MLETIGVEIAKQSIKRIFDKLKREHGGVAIANEKLEEGLNNHLRFVKNWCREFLLQDMVRSRVLADIFVEPMFTEGSTFDRTDLLTNNIIGFREFLNPGKNRIVFGYPGAGKTTLTMALCHHLISEPPSTEEFYDFPIIVRLRDLNETPSLVDHLLDILQIKINLKFKIDNKIIEENPAKLQLIKEQIVIQFLNNHSILLLLDGFDELYFENRRRYRKELERISNNVESSDFLLTTRTQISVGQLNRVQQFFLREFDEESINKFVTLWFNNQEKSLNFLKELSHTPYAGSAVRPLTLASFCILFERYGEIPSPPREIYRRIVIMYLEKWDEHRDIKRVSNYGKFGPDRKREFLSYIAFELAKAKKSTSFTHDTLRFIYSKIYSDFGLPKDQEIKVIREIESHNGLVVQAGFNKYEFYHKSIEEYLCADVLSRRPLLPGSIKSLMNMPDACAIAASLSSDSTSFLAMLVFKLMLDKDSKNIYGQKLNLDAFLNPFLNRCEIEGVWYREDKLLGLSFLTLCSLGWVKYTGSLKYSRRKDYFTFLSHLVKLANQDSVLKSLLGIKPWFRIIANTEKWFKLESLRKFSFYGVVPSEFLVDAHFVSFWNKGIKPKLEDI